MLPSARCFSRLAHTRKSAAKVSWLLRAFVITRYTQISPALTAITFPYERSLRRGSSSRAKDAAFSFHFFSFFFFSLFFVFPLYESLIPQPRDYSRALILGNEPRVQFRDIIATTLFDMGDKKGDDRKLPAVPRYCVLRALALSSRNSGSPPPILAGI